ncbi:MULTISPECIES: hypothetical protein [unclassified Pseudomonas]|uniref:hypothetical protein n=1 Tax=unclassified Pseudomonas TaxID=196821 RepID=UPI0025801E79|nr:MULTISPECIES: hypothetical protein [unclassified Pseudomonas]
MKSRLTTEALIIFLFGGTPLIASYLLGGAKSLEAMIKALITNNNFLMYYLISLFVAFLLVGSLNWLTWKPTDSAREAWKIITAVLHEAGSGVLSIIRIAAGVLLTFPLIWLIAEPEYFKIEKVAHLILYGIIAYVECVIISGWHKDMQRRARVNL